MAYSYWDYTLTLTAATGNQDSPRPYSGRLIAVGFKFTGVPGTTVLTFIKTNTHGPALTLLVTPAGNTDIWYYPLQATVKASDGTAVATWFDNAILDGYVNLAAASSGAGTVQVFLAIQDE